MPAAHPHSLQASKVFVLNCDKSQFTVADYAVWLHISKMKDYSSDISKCIVARIPSHYCNEEDRTDHDILKHYQKIKEHGVYHSVSS